MTRYCRREILDLEPYSAGKTIEEARRESGIADVVKLASNENPYGPSPHALEAITAEVGFVRMYPWNRFTDLKDAIARTFGLAATNVVVGHGSEAIMQLIPMVFVDRGDEVVVPAVTYGRYAEVSKVMGGRIVRAPMDGYRIDTAAMASAFTDRTRLVWLCSPNNPTGTAVSGAEVEGLLEKLPEKAVLVLDQAYQEYSDESGSADGVSFVREGRDNVIVTRSFSKAYGLAGVRLGYGVACEGICALLDTVKEPFNLNRLAAVAGPAALADGAWLERCQVANREERSRLADELRARGLQPVPSQANFVLVDVGADCDRVFDEMMARGVLIRPVSGWGYPTHIRVTVGTPEENGRFLAVLDEVLAAR